MVGVVEREEQGDKIYENAAFTRSGEKGTRRIRTPVASKMALAIVAATGRIDGSPALEAIPRPDTLAPVWSRRGEGRVFQLASPQSP